jgi:hypothetical protein
MTYLVAGLSESKNMEEL